MKKILKFSLVVVAILSTIKSNASSIDFSLAVKYKQGKVVSFAVREVSKIKLSVYDGTNALVNVERITANGLVSRTYDLEALPDGDYFLEAETSLKISRYTISVSEKSAILCPDAVSEIYKPVFQAKNGITSVSIDNRSKNVVSIAVLNTEGETVHESLSLNQNVIKYFDFKGKGKEEYTFVIKYNDTVFYNTVAVR
ncbi:MAG: hypothetical protein K2Y30_12125 [Flavobacteriaceae bacterium]|nr:hypothetical protein [Bacteroidota bacterium]MBX9888667.1 hypothetical protein [Flavobacteriaceae bacterium]